MWLGLINLSAYADSMDELVEGVTLPVLQDTYDDDVAVAWGAEKWYVYVVDADGRLRYLHYSLDLDGEEDRLISEISAAKEPL